MRDVVFEAEQEEEEEEDVGERERREGKGRGDGQGFVSNEWFLVKWVVDPGLQCVCFSLCFYCPAKASKRNS